MQADVLQKLGLTKGESAVYLSLIETGPSSIGKIVELSRVTKSKVYDILNRLKEKGLVSSYRKNNVNYFDAAPPNFLLDIVKKEEESIERKKADIQRIIPSLLMMQKERMAEARAEIFDGFSGLKNAFQIAENEYKAGEEFLVLGVGTKMTAQQLRFFKDHVARRIEAKVKSRVIFTSNLKGVSEYHSPLSKYNEERYLDQQSGMPIDIYKDIVIIPLLGQDTTILIRNAPFARGLREYFETLWKLSKK